MGIGREGGNEKKEALDCHIRILANACFVRTVVLMSMSNLAQCLYYMPLH